MIALDTASFTLEHEGEGSSELLPGLELLVARGEVAMPDRFKIKAETMSLFPRSFFEIQIVVVGDQAFITDPVMETWNPAPIETIPFNFADLGRTLSDITFSLQDPTLSGTEKVDGGPSWRIEGTLPSESLDALVPAAASGSEVGLELWIGRTQGLLRKVRIEGQILSTDVPGVVRLLTIDRFDKPVEISLPVMSDQSS